MTVLRANAIGGRTLPLLAAGAVAATVALAHAPHSSIPPALAGPAVQLTAADLGGFDAAGLFGADTADIAGLAAATGWGAAVENAYNTVEPWAAYGANLLAWLVHWVPWVGLLAPQINIFYDLGEQIVRTLLFSTVEVLDGSTPPLDWFGAVGGGLQSAFGDFFHSEYAWIRGFLPPLPPGFPALPAAAVSDTDPLGHLDTPQLESPHLDLADLGLPGLDSSELPDPGDLLAAVLPDLGL